MRRRRFGETLRARRGRRFQVGLCVRRSVPQAERGEGAPGVSAESCAARTSPLKCAALVDAAARGDVDMLRTICLIKPDDEASQAIKRKCAAHASIAAAPSAPKAASARGRRRGGGACSCRAASSGGRPPYAVR